MTNRSMFVRQHKDYGAQRVTIDTAEMQILLTRAENLQGAGSSQNHLFRQVRARIPIKLLPESISDVSEAVSQELSVRGGNLSDACGSSQHGLLHAPASSILAANAFKARPDSWRRPPHNQQS